MATIANTARDPKADRRPFDYREFHPYLRERFLRRLRDAIPEATDADLERLI